jgi:hypothetical protein
MDLDLEKTPQLFWTGFVFLVLTFVFPPLSWLFGLFALFILVPVVFVNPTYFFGMMWRMMLIAVLLASGFIVAAFVFHDFPAYDTHNGNEYLKYIPQIRIAALAVFTLAASGLVRSFYLAWYWRQVETGRIEG